MSDFLDVALDAAKKAEKILQKHFDSQVTYERKYDNSPVTVADQEAERLVRETITKYFPNHSIIGEEEAEKVGDTKYQWLVDPLDGTKNFIHGLPHFGTLIALCEDGHVIVAVSNMPELKECMYAEKGTGAFLNGTRVHTSEIKDIADAFLLFGGINRFRHAGLMDNLLAVSAKTMGHRGFGDCWMFHLLAQGKAEILIEAKVQAWDIAAGSLLITEAGGVATDLSGRAIGPQSKNIIAANKYLYDQAFACMSTK